MEASTKTVLRCVGLLSMLVLSLAAAPAPAPAPQTSVHSSNSKGKNCAKKCGLVCIPSLELPENYVACFGLCMIACKVFPATSNDGGAYNCTRNCVSSVRNVTIPITNPSVSDLTSYAEGYVDSCSYSCSKNTKLS